MIYGPSISTTSGCTSALHYTLASNPFQAASCGWRSGTLIAIPSLFSPTILKLLRHCSVSVLYECILFGLMLLHCQTSLWSLKVILEQKTLASRMHKRYCGKCTTQHLKGLCSTGGCTQKKTSSWKLPGHNSDGGSAQASRHFLRQVWTKVGMTPTTPYSCEFCT